MQAGGRRRPEINKRCKMAKKFFLSNLISRSRINTFLLRDTKKKIIFIAAVFLVLALIVTVVIVLSNRVNYEAAKEPIREKGMISIGLRSDIPGFAMLDEKSGVIKGFEADVAAEIVKRLFEEGINVQYKDINSKTGKVFINQDILDFTLGAYIQSTAESYLAYTDPYFTDAVVFYVRKGSSITAEQLDGKKIGMVSTSYAGYDSHLEKLFKDKNLTCEYFYYNAYPDAADALKAGKIDVLAGGRVIMQSFSRDMTELTGFVLKHGYRIAIKNTKSELKKALNEILGKMKKDGTIAGLVDKWQLLDYADK